MQTIVLVRHAAATGQDANAALTIEGQRQARMLADLLLQFQIERVISSPLVRESNRWGRSVAAQNFAWKQMIGWSSGYSALETFQTGVTTFAGHSMIWTTIWRTENHLEQRRLAAPQSFERH